MLCISKRLSNGSIAQVDSTASTLPGLDRDAQAVLQPASQAQELYQEGEQYADK